MGRPRKPEAEKYRSPVIGLRVPPALKADLEAAAAAEGKTLSELLLPTLQRLAARKAK